MGFLSLFQRKTTTTEAAPAAAQPGDEVQRARTRARQRLIGAVVLVGIGIVGFPLLFETHPRPIPVDIPIEIASKDKVPPLAMPPARPAAASAIAPGKPSATTRAGVITESASEAGRDVPVPTPNRAAVAGSAPPAILSPKSTVAPVDTAAAKSEAPTPRVTPSNDGARANPAPDGKGSAGAKQEPRTAADGRFVVQVGAFAESNSARETRQRVEKLGFKTYTQVVETAAGSRIRVRVGPFASRDEADRAAGKLKSAGLPAALLTL
jgi:DedD protein